MVLADDLHLGFAGIWSSIPAPSSMRLPSACPPRWGKKAPRFWKSSGVSPMVRGTDASFLPLRPRVGLDSRRRHHGVVFAFPTTALSIGLQWPVYT